MIKEIFVMLCNVHIQDIAGLIALSLFATGVASWLGV